MVVMKIMQGLGNQMFQYAAGRALSLHLQQPLKLNLDNYSDTSLRQYELSKFFGIDTPIVSNQEMAAFNLQHPVRRVWNKVFKNKKIRSLPYEESKQVQRIYDMVYMLRKPHLQRVYEERHFHYDKNFYNANQPVFLKGYWMSYKYFEEYADIIKKDFIVRRELVAHLDGIANDMRSANSIALHIRCGDKLLPQYVALMGILPSSYYEAGIKAIEAKKGKADKVYVFTDTLEAAKEYIPKDWDVVWMSEVTKSPIEDFYLMMQCRNMVISNSTFSWWAAYLNAHADKTVVIPRKWFSNAPYDAKDLYYEGWIKV